MGAMEYVPKCLVTYLKMAGFKGKDIKQNLLTWKKIGYKTAHMTLSLITTGGMWMISFYLAHQNI